jgi:hypothetical protein
MNANFVRNELHEYEAKISKYKTKYAATKTLQRQYNMRVGG